MLRKMNKHYASFVIVWAAGAQNVCNLGHLFTFLNMTFWANFRYFWKKILANCQQHNQQAEKLVLSRPPWNSSAFAGNLYHSLLDLSLEQNIRLDLLWLHHNYGSKVPSKFSHEEGIRYKWENKVLQIAYSLFITFFWKENTFHHF